VYAHDSLYDSLVAESCRQAATLRRSQSAGDGGHYGPMIFDKQAATIDRQFDDALGKGAKIVFGGKSESIDGAVWVDPTIVTDVDHSMSVMTEETFGPIVPVMRFHDEAEAERLANDSIYGLSGAVFGPDTHTAGDFATKMEAGGVRINDTELPRVMMFDGEKTAFKKSGMGGSRCGATSIMRYVRKRALLANEGAVQSLDKLSNWQKRAADRIWDAQRRDMKWVLNVRAARLGKDASWPASPRTIGGIGQMTDAQNWNGHVYSGRHSLT
jgi:acyl-CoA reductase-like NAD-dependent aldehyde dehydrogenase